MPLTVEISGELEEKLSRLVMSGRYSTMSEVVRDAVRHFIATQDMREVAVSLYRQGKISLALAAKIAEASVLKMAELLAERGICPEIGVESSEELVSDYEALRRRK